MKIKPAGTSIDRYKEILTSIYKNHCFLWLAESTNRRNSSDIIYKKCSTTLLTVGGTRDWGNTSSYPCVRVCSGHHGGTVKMSIHGIKVLVNKVVLC